MDLDALASFDGFGNLLDSGEEEQQTYCTQYAPIYLPDRRAKETTDNQSQTEYKGDVEHSHSCQWLVEGFGREPCDSHPFTFKD